MVAIATRRMMLAAAVLVGLVVGAAGRAKADLVFTNLGPGDSYNQFAGAPISSGQDLGAPFTPTATFTFSEAELALGLSFGPNSVTVQLRADDTGHPGSILESFTINGQMPTFGSFGSDHFVVASSALHPTLDAGSQYWITDFRASARGSHAASAAVEEAIFRGFSPSPLECGIET